MHKSQYAIKFVPSKILSFWFMFVWKLLDIRNFIICNLGKMHFNTKDLSYFEICGSCNSYDVQFHGYKIKLTLERRQNYDKTTTLRHLAVWRTHWIRLYLKGNKKLWHFYSFLSYYTTLYVTTSYLEQSTFLARRSSQCYFHIISPLFCENASLLLSKYVSYYTLFTIKYQYFMTFLELYRGEIINLWNDKFYPFSNLPYST